MLSYTQLVHNWCEQWPNEQRDFDLNVAVEIWRVLHADFIFMHDGVTVFELRFSGTLCIIMLQQPSFRMQIVHGIKMTEIYFTDLVCLA